MSSTEIRTRSYMFGPLEKRGVLVGLRAGQLLVIAASFLLALFLMNSVPTNIGIPLAVVVIAAGATVSWVQVLNRGLDEWIPVLFRWSSSRITNGNQWFSTMPLLGNLESKGATPGPGLDDEPGDDKGKKKRVLGKPDAAARKRTNDPSSGLPPTLRNLSILEVPVGDGPATIGVIKDAKNGLYTAVLAVRGDAFLLLEESEKERRLQGWADVLGNLAKPSSFVHRIQWIERAVPDDGDALNRYLAEARVQPDSAPTVRSYIDLLEEFGPVSQQHETFVAVQISAVKSGRVVKKAGGGDKGSCMVLIRELRQLADSLASADIHVDGALSPRLLALTFRNAFDPHARRKLVKRGRVDPERAGVATNNAWPLATEVAWDSYRTEDVHHATFWISEWPRLEVGPDFMAPLMVRTQRIRTVSLIMQPIEGNKAQREVESAHTAYLADEELRNRAGYVTSERRKREFESVLRRESELADGFSEYRFAGYVTITADTLKDLEEACSEVEQQAQQARLELRRLFGEQDIAFTCTLPLCRGLKG